MAYLDSWWRAGTMLVESLLPYSKYGSPHPLHTLSSKTPGCYQLSVYYISSYMHIPTIKFNL